MKNLNKNRIFRFNRRIRGQTDYSLRLKLLKSQNTRAIVRRSNKNMLVQFANYNEKGDKILTSAKACELRKYGFTLNTGNLVASYLTGLLAGKRLLKTGFKDKVIVDLGLQNSNFRGSRLYATVNGLVDSGLDITASDVVFPTAERLDGSHLSVKDAEKVVKKVMEAINKL